MFWKLALLAITLLFLAGFFSSKEYKQNFYAQRWYPVNTITDISQLTGEKLVFEGVHYTTFDAKTFQADQSREGHFLMGSKGSDLLFLDEKKSNKVPACYLVTNGTYGGYDICRSVKFPDTAYERTSKYNVKRDTPLELLAENKEGLLIEFYYEDGQYNQYLFKNMPYFFSGIALSPDNSTVFFHALEWVDSETNNVKHRINRFYIFKESKQSKTGSLTLLFEDEKPNTRAFDNFKFSNDGKGVYYTYKNDIYFLDIETKKSSKMISTPFKIMSHLKVSPNGQLGFIGDGYFQTPGSLCIVDPEQPEKLTRIVSSAYLADNVSNYIWSPTGKKIAIQAVKSENDVIEGVNLKVASSYKIENRKLFIYDVETEKVTEIYDKHVNPKLIAWINK